MGPLEGASSNHFAPRPQKSVAKSFLLDVETEAPHALLVVLDDLSAVFRALGVIVYVGTKLEETVVPPLFCLGARATPVDRGMVSLDVLERERKRDGRGARKRKLTA